MSGYGPGQAQFYADSPALTAFPFSITMLLQNYVAELDERFETEGEAIADAVSRLELDSFWNFWTDDYFALPPDHSGGFQNFYGGTTLLVDDGEDRPDAPLRYRARVTQLRFKFRFQSGGNYLKIFWDKVLTSQPDGETPPVVEDTDAVTYNYVPADQGNGLSVLTPINTSQSPSTGTINWVETETFVYDPPEASVGGAYTNNKFLSLDIQKMCWSWVKNFEPVDQYFPTPPPQFTRGPGFPFA